MPSGILGHVEVNQPTKKQLDEAHTRLADFRAAQKAYLHKKTPATLAALVKAQKAFNELPTLTASERGGRRHRTRRRGGMGEATLRRVKDLFGFTKPVPQEKPQDVARRRWCDANFGRIPARQLQCYQEAPDDVSSSKPWPKHTRAGRRRSTRRGARASRKRPTR